MSCKKVKCCSSQGFASDLLVNLKALREHTERMISQYQQIKEIKKIVSDDSQKTLCIHVNWSQNGNLFQARQEKGAYYHELHELQVSINTVVAYMSTNVSSHCTISDAKSHKAPAVWASLEKILGSFDLDRLQVLYIITDSPTSQYCNKYNAYLTKKFAIQHNLTIIWVFTESGHGKVPMNGVGASIKNEIDNAIAFNPNSVITCASELWEFLPKDNKQISMYSEEDVQRYKEMLPSDLKIACKSFGISSIHEIKFSPLDDNQLSWKKVSADTEYTNVSLTKISSKNTGGKDNQVKTTNQSQEAGILFT